MPVDEKLIESVNEVVRTVKAIESRLAVLERKDEEQEKRIMRGGLKAPIDNDTILALKEDFIIVGTVVLASGVATITDRRIKASSTAFVCYKSISTAGTYLSISCGDGTASVASQNVADASTLYFLIII